MSTFSEAFSMRKEVVGQKLQNTESVSTVVSLLQDEIKVLANLDGSTMGKLGVGQARLAQTMLELIHISLNGLATLKWKPTLTAGQPIHEASNTDGSMNIVIGGVAGAIAGAGVGMLIGGPVGAAIGAAVGTVVGGGVKDYAQKDKDYQVTNSHVAPLPAGQLQVNAWILLSFIEQALQRIDQTIACEMPSPSVEKRNLDLTEYADVLRLLQALLDNNYKAEPLSLPLRAQLGKIPNLLHQYGIQVTYYSPTMVTNEAAVQFDFDPSIDPTVKEYVNLTPALLKDKRVLLRGRVIEPVINEL